MRPYKLHKIKSRSTYQVNQNTKHKVLRKCRVCRSVPWSWLLPIKPIMIVPCICIIYHVSYLYIMYYFSLPTNSVKCFTFMMFDRSLNPIVLALRNMFVWNCILINCMYVSMFRDFVFVYLCVLHNKFLITVHGLDTAFVSSSSLYRSEFCSTHAPRYSHLLSQETCINHAENMYNKTTIMWVINLELLYVF